MSDEKSFEETNEYNEVVFYLLAWLAFWLIMEIKILFKNMWNEILFKLQKKYHGAVHSFFSERRLDLWRRELKMSRRSSIKFYDRRNLFTRPNFKWLVLMEKIWSKLSEHVENVECFTYLSFDVKHAVLIRVTFKALHRKRGDISYVPIEGADLNLFIYLMITGGLKNPLTSDSSAWSPQEIGRSSISFTSLVFAMDSRSANCVSELNYLDR